MEVMDQRCCVLVCQKMACTPLSDTAMGQVTKHGLVRCVITWYSFQAGGLRLALLLVMVSKSNSDQHDEDEDEDDDDDDDDDDEDEDEDEDDDDDDDDAKQRLIGMKG